MNKSAASAKVRGVTSRLRAALVLGVIAAAEVVAAPAFASTSEGRDNGVGLTVIQTVLLYLVAPVVIFGIITLLVVGPSLARATNEDKTGVHRPVLGESPPPRP